MRLAARSRIVLVALASSLLGAAITSAQTVRPGPTPLPTVTGPLPVTTASYPYLMASKALEPMDLATIGYVEEEFFIIRGTAHVYD